MEVLQGVGLLLICLTIFTIFSLKAPMGMQAMSGMAAAAIASFLVEAIQLYIGGEILGIKFLGDLGTIAGTMSGVAAASLVALKMGVNPLYAVLVGLACGGYGILPGFIAGYVVGLTLPYIEKRVTPGLDLLIVIIFIAPAVRLVGSCINPLVNSTLGQIGEILTVAANQSPIIMGVILGGIAAVIGTSPLSSMALTAMLGLTGLPMAIAGLGILAVSFTNGLLFHKLGFGDKGSIVSVMIEPLTQADIISSKPIPIYTTNFIGGGLAGIVVALSGLLNNAPGTASPIPAVIVLFGWNDPVKVVIITLTCALCGFIIGIIGARVFSYYKKSHFETLKESENVAQVQNSLG
ncbi:PTS sugar transporter subunit IIC [Metabacillus niabensis]|uniref:PTS sugar transporter subunit IIC n=1 Tax=Metabacillus niabensis TaxID=324854 RepID=UPI001CFA6E91|nr:PTS sugar transporter subunit IIC [Metabacillus niabensis]